MLTKNDFTAEEWTTLRQAPHLVGVATMLAGASGLGTLKESIAAAKMVMDGQSSNVPLIRDLSGRDEAKAAQDSILEEAKSAGADAQGKMQSLALESVRKSLSILHAKGADAEASELSTWLTSIAEGVAKAAKEGGFLGFGGTQVSEGEKAFLAKLSTALQGSSSASA